jgi:hypothetical protein
MVLFTVFNQYMVVQDYICGVAGGIRAENVSGIVKFFKPYVSNIDKIIWRMESDHGGRCIFDVGGIVIDNKFFDELGLFPFPELFNITAQYLFKDGSKQDLFNRMPALLKSVSPTSGVLYNIKEPLSTTKLLSAAPDFNGETGRLYPRAFGNVSCIPLLRVGTTSNQQYHKAYIVGTTPGTDYDVYDDGVKINENVSADDGTKITLSKTPIGQIRMSGNATGNDTLVEFFTDFFSFDPFDTTLAKSPSPEINCFISEQMYVHQLASEFCAVNNHLFYTHYDHTGDTRKLIDMEADNGTLVIDKFVDARYVYNDPVEKIEANWTYMDIGTTPDGYIEYVDKKDNLKLFINQDYTSHTINIDPYNNDKSKILIQLQNIAINQLRVRATIRLYVEHGYTIVPGMLLTWTDERFPMDFDVAIRARDISYNVNSDEDFIEVTGEGNIFSTPGTPTNSQYLSKQIVDFKALFRKIRENKTFSTVSPIKGQGDYLTIEEAIDDMPDGGTIYIKNYASGYDIDSAVTLTNKNWTFIGESKENVTVEFTPSTGRCFTMTGTPGSIDVVFKNITFVSSYNSNNFFYNGGITTSTMNLEIDNCDFDEFSSVIEEFKGKNLTVKNGCQFTNQTLYGIKTANSTVSGILTVRECLFDGGASNTTFIGIKTLYVGENFNIHKNKFFNGNEAINISYGKTTITDNRIETFNKGILCSNGSETMTVTVLANQLIDIKEVGIEGSAYQILLINLNEIEMREDLGASVTLRACISTSVDGRVKIIDNILKIADTTYRSPVGQIVYGIKVDGHSSGKITDISGNDIDIKTFSGSSETANTYGIYIEDAKVKIIKNDIKVDNGLHPTPPTGINTVLIDLLNVDKSRIDGNTFEANVASTLDKGIRLNATCDDNLANNNHMTSNVDDVLDDSSTNFNQNGNQPALT